MELSIRKTAAIIFCFIWSSSHLVWAKPANATDGAGTEENPVNSSFPTLPEMGEVRQTENGIVRLTLETVDMSDWHQPEVTTCPHPCTCIADSIVHCSRSGITSIGPEDTTGDSSTFNGNVLHGKFPSSALAVHLGYNNITTLPAKLFQQMIGPNGAIISNLYLHHNQINTIRPDAFVNLPELQVLDLSNNLMTHLVQPCEPFRIMEDSSGSGESPDDVQSLLCSENQEAIFLLSLPKSLRTLNLNWNLLRGIPNLSFRYLENLETLTLSWNQITWISRRAFVGLHKLKVLQLRSNPLGPKTSSKLEDILQHFTMALIPLPPEDNRDFLDENIHRLNTRYPNGRNRFLKRGTGSTQSRRRRFHRSHLTEAREIFNVGSTDTRLNIGNHNMRKMHRDIRSVDSPVFERIALKSLQELDLGETNLLEIPSTLPPSLVRLYMDSNFIADVPAEIIRNIGNLKILNLGSNRIQHLPDSVFSGLNELRVLDLSRNDLSQLTSNTFNGLMRVWSLRLNGNLRLSELPDKVFWSMPSLGLLYLQDCNLSTVPSGPWIYRIYALWLYGNPVTCDCKTILPIASRLLQPQSRPLRIDPYRAVIWDDGDTWKYQRPEKTVCASPGHFRGYRMAEVLVRDLRCTLQDWYDVSVSRMMASSRFLSKDYQQDESKTATKEDYENPNYEMGENMSEYFEDSIEKLDVIEDLPKQTERDIFEEPPNEEKDIHTGDDLRDDDFLFGFYDNKKDLEENPNNQSKISSTEKDNKHDTKNSSSADEENINLDELMRPDIQKDLNAESHHKESAKAESDFGQDWVFELPIGAIFENSNGTTEMYEGDLVVHEAKDRHFVKLDQLETDEDMDNLASGVPPDTEIVNNENEDKSTRVISLDVSNGYANDEDEELYEEDWTPENPQGFHEYPIHDEGIVIRKDKATSSFEEDVKIALSADDVHEYNKRIQEFNIWDAYEDYYTELDSSGDMDSSLSNDDYYQDAFYDLEEDWTTVSQISLKDLEESLNISDVLNEKENREAEMLLDELEEYD